MHCESESYAQYVVNQLQQSKAVHFLSLDANRCIPKKNLNLMRLPKLMKSTGKALNIPKGVHTGRLQLCMMNG